MMNSSVSLGDWTKRYVDPGMSDLLATEPTKGRALGNDLQRVLVPLLGCAEATERAAGLFEDAKARDIVQSIAQVVHIDRWFGKPLLRAAALRSRMLDEDVSVFLLLHPAGTVVELGCGLSSRGERLHNGRSTWVALDSPPVVSMRRRFFTQRTRHRMIGCPLLDPTWIDAVRAIGGPWCFVAETALLSLTEHEARAFVSRLSQEFPGCWLLAGTRSACPQRKSCPLREDWHRWKCDSPRVLCEWVPSLCLDRSRTLMDASSHLRRCFSCKVRCLLRVAPQCIEAGMEGFRLNRYVDTQQQSAGLVGP